ncbi:hypothetical protein D917_02283 [Trichinella nativa]|uniref:Uncharacterized protein n=1 Tax=Trichinella nativa TaxID=6335 RepID=A0A1Y3EGN7_9BILA|nr:hypothetical protein D917_02283 [Trichinella nativa]
MYLLLLHLIALESFLSDKFASDLSRWLACRMLCFSWCFVHLVSPLMRFACGRRLARFSSCSVGSAFYEQMQKSNWDFTTPDASKFVSGCFFRLHEPLTVYWQCWRFDRTACFCSLHTVSQLIG